MLLRDWTTVNYNITFAHKIGSHTEKTKKPVKFALIYDYTRPI